MGKLLKIPGRMFEKAKAALKAVMCPELRKKASLAAAAWVIKQMNRRAKQKPPAKTDC